MVKSSMMAGALAALAGCTAYAPAPGPRVAEVSGGYVRDGVTYPAGFLGSGLVTALHGKPAAEEEARTSQRLSWASFVLEVTGGAAQVVGLPTALSSHDPTTQHVAYGALALGGVLVVTGLILGMKATASHMDAINMYNEGSGEARVAWPPTVHAAP